MAIAADNLRQLLDKAFPDADIELEDLVGDSNHYRLRIISKDFSTLSKVAQHRLVYDALGSIMGGDLHALSIETRSVS